MADAHEGGGQRVQQEAPDEFFRGQSHGFGLVAVAAIAEGEGDIAVFDVKDAVVGNSDAVGIAAEVVEDLFRPAERGLGVDDPGLFVEPGEEVIESGPGPERVCLARENKFAAVEGPAEEAGILAAEYCGESPDRKEELLRGGNPAAAVFGQRAGGDEAVEMDVLQELLVPGVEQGDEPGFAAEVVPAESEKCPGGGVKEDFQEEPLVGKDEGIEFMRECEDDVEIADGQDFGAAGLESALLIKSLALGAMAVAVELYAGFSKPQQRKTSCLTVPSPQKPRL